MVSPHPPHGGNAPADPQLLRRHGHQGQAGAPDPQHAAGGVYVDLLVAVRQDACVVLQIQLAAAHHLQVGQARHQICRQVEQLRHRVQHAAVSVLSIPLHTFTSSRLYAQTSRNMPGA